MDTGRPRDNNTPGSIVGTPRPHSSRRIPGNKIRPPPMVRLYSLNVDRQWLQDVLICNKFNLCQFPFQESSECLHLSPERRLQPGPGVLRGSLSGPTSTLARFLLEDSANSRLSSWLPGGQTASAGDIIKMCVSLETAAGTPPALLRYSPLFEGPMGL